jgi:hypothetical protein
MAEQRQKDKRAFKRRVEQERKKLYLLCALRPGGRWKGYPGMGGERMRPAHHLRSVKHREKMRPELVEGNFISGG